MKLKLFLVFAYLLSTVTLSFAAPTTYLPPEYAGVETKSTPPPYIKGPTHIKLKHQKRSYVWLKDGACGAVDGFIGFHLCGDEHSPAYLVGEVGGTVASALQPELAIGKIAKGVFKGAKGISRIFKSTKETEKALDLSKNLGKTPDVLRDKLQKLTSTSKGGVTEASTAGKGTRSTGGVNSKGTTSSSGASHTETSSSKTSSSGSSNKSSGSSGQTKESSSKTSSSGSSKKASGGSGQTKESSSKSSTSGSSEKGSSSSKQTKEASSKSSSTGSSKKGSGSSGQTKESSSKSSTSGSSKKDSGSSNHTETATSQHTGDGGAAGTHSDQSKITAEGSKHSTQAPKTTTEHRGKSTTSSSTPTSQTKDKQGRKLSAQQRRTEALARREEKGQNTSTSGARKLPEKTPEQKEREAYLKGKFKHAEDIHEHIYVENNRRIAIEEMKRQGVTELKEIEDKIKGINLKEHVEVITVNRNKKLIQYQAPGRGQGDFYTTKEINPDHLGINPRADTPTQKDVLKVPNQYITKNKKVKMLTSTAGREKDTWSTPGRTYHAKGGGKQFYSRDKDAFKKIEGK
ncbi:MAG: polymorphic toxin type 46 domain-containing protein [Neisseriaceae bacterium]